MVISRGYPLACVLKATLGGVEEPQFQTFSLGISGCATLHQTHGALPVMGGESVA